MIYIIAHGTVNGYNKVYQPSNCGNEINVITDIRSEFDNTDTMLEKPIGYLLQIYPNGVWISVVKLLFDGERSGNGPGFFAFSAFVPTQIYIEGSVIKQTLFNLMNTYLTMLSKEYYTRNIGIDWSFVELASKELNAQCKPRKKNIKINYTPSDKFAFVNVETDDHVAKYLDKPFQPEYGAYKAVFIGSQLLNPNRKSTYNQLSIDIENDVYDVIWKGSEYDFPDLPNVVRKNEIDTKYYVFSKTYFENRIVYLKDGDIDDVNTTITINVPQLEPIRYSLKFNINHPEGVVAIIAKNTVAKPLVSDDKESLVFEGEQVSMLWHIVIQTNESFLPKEFDIIPFDHINNEYEIQLEEAQLIKVRILYEGNLDTNKQSQRIKFYNKHTATIEHGEYKNDTKCIEFRIHRNEDFLDVYNVSLDDYNIREYDLSLIRIDGNNNIVNVNIKKKISSIIVANGKTIKVRVPRNIADSKIEYSYREKSDTLIDCCPMYEEYKVFKMNVPNDLHRNEITFNIAGKPLNVHIASEDNTTIIINGFASVSDSLKFKFKQHKTGIVLSFISIQLIIILFLICYFLLSNLGYIGPDDDDEYEDTNVPIVEIPIEVNGDNETSLSIENSPTYIKLKNVLDAQKDAWNYKLIYDVAKEVAGPGGRNTEKLKKEDPNAYECLKQLGWLWRTRDIVNKQEWNRLPYFVSANNEKFKNEWKSYADNDKIKFLRDVLRSEKNTRDKFKGKISSTNDFENKKFSEILQIWSICKQKSSGTVNGESAKQANKTDDVIDNSMQPASEF